MDAICIIYGDRHIATVHTLESGGWQIDLHDDEADTVRLKEGETPAEGITRYRQRLRDIERIFDEIDNMPDPWDET
jgi:hypothetical protein